MGSGVACGVKTRRLEIPEPCLKKAGAVESYILHSAFCIFHYNKVGGERNGDHL